MWTDDQGLLREFAAINATWRVAYKNQRAVCVVTDIATGVEYVTADAASESDAVYAALAKAKVTPKPLTQSQKAFLAETGAKDARAADLEKRLAETEAKLAAAEAKLKAPLTAGVEEPFHMPDAPKDEKAKTRRSKSIAEAVGAPVA